MVRPAKTALRCHVPGEVGLLFYIDDHCAGGRFKYSGISDHDRAAEKKGYRCADVPWDDSFPNSQNISITRYPIGLIGTGIGGLAGLALTFAQKEFSLVKLSSSFIIDAYPVSVQTSDIFMVMTGTMVLCLLASWYPSTRASRVEPADAVREE